MTSADSLDGIFVNSLTLGNETTIDLKRNSVLLLTGPNNCGKSQTLRDLINLFLSLGPSFVLKGASFGFEGDFHKIFLELCGHPMLRTNSLWLQQQFITSGGDIRRFCNLVSQNLHYRSICINAVTSYLSTFTRLISLGTANDQAPLVNVQPFALASLARLYENQATADKIYTLTKNAFGKGVMMNHAAFQDSNLYYVEKSEIDARQDKGTSSFARWFDGLERLNQQGDGVQAFCAIIIPIIQQRTPLILLDEPEAFLHPPQIRELGRIIATETSARTQLLIATHSDIFLRAMIDFAEDRVSVIRITKRTVSGQQTNSFKKLDADEISKLWLDPLLKTSDALTSLFHRIAVIVEGDSDARFYRAMLDKVEDEAANSLDVDASKSALDLKFFHCGGKDKIAKIAAALRAIGVPIVCIVDIDILDDKEKFLRLIDCFGGIRADFVDQITSLTKFVSEQKSTQNVSDARTKLESLFSDLDLNKPIPTSKLQDMYAALNNASAWSLVKRGGESFFTQGDPYNAWKDIQKKSESLGIVINKHGELECLCKTISARNKSEWLTAVLDKNLQDAEDLADARAFVQKLSSVCRQALATQS